MKMDKNKYTETVVEMTTQFWNMVAEGELCTPEDSREIWQEIMSCAEGFEKLHSNTDWDDVDSNDYYEAIEEYVYPRFTKAFGVDPSEKDIDTAERIDLIGTLIDVVEDFITDEGFTDDYDPYIVGDKYDRLAESFKAVLNYGSGKDE